MRRLLLAVLLLGMLPALAYSQAPLRINRFPTTPAALRSAGASTVGMAAAGLLGGAVGLVAFGYIGALITDNTDENPEDDLSALPGLVVGATLGESVLMPVGVHLANGRRGRLLPAVLAATAIGAAGVLAAIATEDQAPLPGIILGVTPIAQLITSIAIERRTAR